MDKLKVSEKDKEEEEEEKEKKAKDTSVLVVTPRINSRFSPAVMIGKSPAMQKSKTKAYFDTSKNKKLNELLKYGTKKDKIIEEKNDEGKIQEEEKIPKPNKYKGRTSLIAQNLKNELLNEEGSKLRNYDDMPITEGIQFDGRSELNSNSIKSEVEIEGNNLDDDEEEEMKEGIFYKEDETKYYLKLFKKDLCC